MYKHKTQRKRKMKTIQSDYNYNLFQQIISVIKAQPENFSMDEHLDEQGRKDIAGWALTLSNINIDLEHTYSYSVAPQASRLLNVSNREINLLLFLLEGCENRTNHIIGILEWIVEKRNLTVEEIINIYVESNGLKPLQVSSI